MDRRRGVNYAILQSGTARRAVHESRWKITSPAPDAEQEDGMEYGISKNIPTLHSWENVVRRQCRSAPPACARSCGADEGKAEGAVTPDVEVAGAGEDDPSAPG